MSALRLVSVNIERSKHLDLVVPFLKAQQADVVCLQECMERDIPLLKSVAGEHVLYTPLCVIVDRPNEPDGVYGQAIFSKSPFVSTLEEYYAGEYDPIPSHGNDKAESILRVARALSAVEIEKGGATYRIATTHFTWSAEGAPSETQREDLQKLLEILRPFPDLILTGDFNTPRGTEIFDAIAAKYRDNIPAKYTTSIYGPFHRAGPLPYMVDGLFSTLAYEVTDVELHSGVSDHCAITASISRK